MLLKNNAFGAQNQLEKHALYSNIVIFLYLKINILT